MKKIFEDNFKNGEEENSQLCVYVGGKKVIDLYGTAVGDTSYGPDTLTVRLISKVLHTIEQFTVY